MANLAALSSDNNNSNNNNNTKRKFVQDMAISKHLLITLAKRVTKFSFDTKCCH